MRPSVIISCVAALLLWGLSLGGVGVWRATNTSAPEELAHWLYTSSITTLVATLVIAVSVVALNWPHDQPSALQQQRPLAYRLWCQTPFIIMYILFVYRVSLLLYRAVAFSPHWDCCAFDMTLVLTQCLTYALALALGLLYIGREVTTVVCTTTTVK